ncbi:carboxypeptidase-like regulatory domain-containing protein [Pseudobacteriovorax antillogorgiicola]|uniref:Carboxypeptidase regulatory-like domain-containing protein n=1 Tax=Pseudobacteriovorax antillogorgiicola TaxID=1513793 RepID=A0A1Y6BJN3_9BACT|nr:carboxypeptidase-like regulatory domain-containing protein [Pseudobacteriovorax antillogorgiicola]TCS55391.1 hypothetical protein EDD56_105112 [Pseudobacteriovorax antillogorgiicola]SMF13120.1 hypothetical protein SAMN06296036_105212 [Pseudobacteriovorax antillogorgiicola]
MWKLIVAVALLGAGCLPSAKESLTSSSSEFALVGSLVGPDGLPVPNTNIYVENQPSTIGKSDLNGRFEISFSDEQKRRLESVLNSQGRSSFRLFFIHETQNLVGSSPEVPFTGSGYYQLAKLSLDEGLELEGQVSGVDRNRGLIKIPEANVRLGRWQAKTDSNGAFKLSGIPKGELALEVFAPGYQRQTQSVLTNNDDFQSSLKQLTLFLEPGSTGVLVEDADAFALAGDDPLKRWLSVRYTSDVQFIRVSEDIRELELTGESNAIIIDQDETGNDDAILVEAAAWLPIAPRLSYQFDGVGSKTLYYQFGDASQENPSEIFQVTIDVDLFGAAQASITINEGELTTTSSSVSIQLGIPESAVSMRLGETREDFEGEDLVYSDLATNFTYQFSSDMKGNGERTLMVQFVDQNGNRSRIYQASIELILFPEDNSFIDYQVQSQDLASATVEIQFILPPNAAEYRLYDIALNGEDAAWLPAARTHLYEMDSLVARYVYIQFRDNNQVESDIYQILIEADEIN